MVNKLTSGVQLLAMIGLALGIWNGGASHSGDIQANNGADMMGGTVPMSGLVDAEIPVVGLKSAVSTGETGDYATDFGVSNQHVYILVNTITTGGDIVITGTSISESTQGPSPADTETITVDTTAGQLYQSSKKWWEVTNIDISSGTIVNIDYDIGRLGYADFGNRNFKIFGYRVDYYASAASPDVLFHLYKVMVDSASKKVTLVDLERLGVDINAVGDVVVDDLRTGDDDRSYNTTVSAMWGNNGVLTLKMGDFEEYYASSRDNWVYGSLGEGIILDFEGVGGGITGVQYATWWLYWQRM